MRDIYQAEEILQLLKIRLRCCLVVVQSSRYDPDSTEYTSGNNNCQLFFETSFELRYRRLMHSDVLAESDVYSRILMQRPRLLQNRRSFDSTL